MMVSMEKMLAYIRTNGPVTREQIGLHFLGQIPEDDEGKADYARQFRLLIGPIKRLSREGEIRNIGRIPGDRYVRYEAIPHETMSKRELADRILSHYSAKASFCSMDVCKALNSPGDEVKDVMAFMKKYGIIVKVKAPQDRVENYIYYAVSRNTRVRKHLTRLEIPGRWW